MKASRLIKAFGAIVLILIGFIIFGMGFVGDLFYGHALITAKGVSTGELLFIVGLYSCVLLAGVILVLTGIHFWKKVRSSNETMRNRTFPADSSR